MMRAFGKLILPLVGGVLLVGCSSPSESLQVPTAPKVVSRTVAAGSDAESVRAANYSILFIGNSHSSFHDLPELVCRLIEFRHPEQKAYSRLISTGFLEQAANMPECLAEIDQRPWKFVILQAQKISVSGRHEYSRLEGIDLAKRARERGAGVYYFSEWGLRDVPDNGPRHQRVYQEMAEAAEAGVVPVGRAWEIALKARPELPLYESDGNHQSATGAFLTACMLFGRITGDSPIGLEAFPYEHADRQVRSHLAESAAKALEQLPDRLQQPMKKAGARGPADPQAP